LYEEQNKEVAFLCMKCKMKGTHCFV